MHLTPAIGIAGIITGIIAGSLITAPDTHHYLADCYLGDQGTVLEVAPGIMISEPGVMPQHGGAVIPAQDGVIELIPLGEMTLPEARSRVATLTLDYGPHLCGVVRDHDVWRLTDPHNSYMSITYR